MFSQQVQAIVNAFFFFVCFCFVSCYILVAFEGEGVFCFVLLLTCLCLIKLDYWCGDSVVPKVGEGGVPSTSHFTLPLLSSIPALLPPVPAVTPLQAQQFSWELWFHPNRQQVDCVLDGIHHGFKLGFCHTQRLKPAKKNKSSADQHASVIDEYLANEVSQDRVVDLFDSSPLPNLQVSSFGVIPKQGQVGSGLIVDLSTPYGFHCQ